MTIPQTITGSPSSKLTSDSTQYMKSGERALTIEKITREKKDTMTTIRSKDKGMIVPKI